MSVATCMRACVVLGILGRCEATGSRSHCHLLNPSSIISLFLSLSFSLPSPSISLSHIPLSELHLSPSSSFSPLFYLCLCTERWTPAVWRHHKVTRNLRHKIHTSKWCKPRAPISLESTSAVCSHSVYTMLLQGKHSTAVHCLSQRCAELHSIIVLSCVFLVL